MPKNTNTTVATKISTHRWMCQDVGLWNNETYGVNLTCPSCGKPTFTMCEDDRFYCGLCGCRGAGIWEYLLRAKGCCYSDQARQWLDSAGVEYPNDRSWEGVYPNGPDSVANVRNQQAAAAAAAAKAAKFEAMFESDIAEHLPIVEACLKRLGVLK